MIKVEVNCTCVLTEHHAFLTSVPDGSSGHIHVPAALPQGKSPWYPLDRRLGGPQIQSGRGGEKKISQLLPGLEPPIIQLIAQRYTTELSYQNPYQHCNISYMYICYKYLSIFEKH
jgi:hypothetical protein